MYTATLRCGTVLDYEARSFRPDPGDLVPCRRHGFCSVQLTSGPASGGAFGRRASRRSHGELLDWLGGRSQTTVHALLRRGFTLRMVAAAERDGVVDVDVWSGEVKVLAGDPRRGDAMRLADGARSTW